MELRQKQDAGVQRARAAFVSHHSRAGPAVAFVAALFGASQALRFAQPIKQGHGRRTIDVRRFSIQRERKVNVKSCRVTRRSKGRCAPSMRRRERAPLVCSGLKPLGPWFGKT